MRKQRRVFASHRQAGLSKRRRRQLEKDKQARGLEPARVHKLPYGTAIALAFESACLSRPSDTHVIPRHMYARSVVHHERIPTRDTWTVLDNDTKELLGSYPNGKAATKASAYFARFGHVTLVRRVI